jgi:hypothetical protein
VDNRVTCFQDGDEVKDWKEFPENVASAGGCGDSKAMNSGAALRTEWAEKR